MHDILQDSAVKQKPDVKMVKNGCAHWTIALTKHSLEALPLATDLSVWFHTSAMNFLSSKGEVLRIPLNNAMALPTLASHQSGGCG